MIQPGNNGGGGDVQTDKESRKTAKLIRRAVNGRWSIPDSILDDAPEVMADLVVNASSPRTCIQAAQTLVAMARCNVETNKAEKEGELIDHMLERFPEVTEETHATIRDLHRRLGSFQPSEPSAEPSGDS